MEIKRRCKSAYRQHTHNTHEHAWTCTCWPCTCDTLATGKCVTGGYQRQGPWGVTSDKGHGGLPATKAMGVTSDKGLGGLPATTEDLSAKRSWKLKKTFAKSKCTVLHSPCMLSRHRRQQHGRRQCRRRPLRWRRRNDHSECRRRRRPLRRRPRRPLQHRSLSISHRLG